MLAVIFHYCLLLFTFFFLKKKQLIEIRVRTIYLFIYLAGTLHSKQHFYFLMEKAGSLARLGPNDVIVQPTLRSEATTS